ncbi:acyltransferase [Chitinilyticum piscinae]|uniref:Acyltransferase n=1 Tax=Chitinilyticum piscinae TaxID=2866724 RepID=A0A8J7K1Q9_9NEIS|nr:acyltransferase [Chitinilyticum piscinae]MBE9609566.1 acyltransferase [Chitinilyticum piscinae]
MKTLLLGFCRPWLAAVHASCLHMQQGLAWLLLAVRIPLPPSCVIMGGVELHGTRAIRTGEECLFYPGLYLETRGNGRLDIGAGVVCSRGVHLVAYEGIRIGEGCMLGEYVSIRDANHVRVNGQTLRASGHRARAIEIGREVWIGRGAIILPGVHIGDRATIAANAVVSHDVAADAVVGGVPARVLHSAKELQP